MLSRIAWIGVVGGGFLAVLARLQSAAVIFWIGLGLIALGFIAMCWLGGHAFEDLRANKKDDTEAK